MRFRSKLEEKIAALLKQSRIDYTYESIKLPYILECNYHPDFILPNGTILEAKGVLDVDDRRKMIAVKESHPDKDIRFVFQNPHSRMKGVVKETHAQWADRRGFLWCHYQNIPTSWLD